MVDSRKGDVMADRIDEIVATLDRRFDEVLAAIVEQREYIEFGYQRLAATIDALDVKFEARFAQIDERFAALEARVEALEARIASLETKVDALREEMDERFSRLDARFDRFELKFDRFIEVQFQTNALIDRRLTLLEQRPTRLM